MLIESCVPPVTPVPILGERGGGNHHLVNQFMFSSFICSLISIPLGISLFFFYYPAGAMAGSVFPLLNRRVGLVRPRIKADLVAFQAAGDLFFPQYVGHHHVRQSIRFIRFAISLMLVTQYGKFKIIRYTCE